MFLSLLARASGKTSVSFAEQRRNEVATVFGDVLLLVLVVVVLVLVVVVVNRKIHILNVGELSPESSRWGKQNHVSYFCCVAGYTLVLINAAYEEPRSK